MDPRVLAHFDGDLTRANLQPAQARADPRGVPAAGRRPRAPRTRPAAATAAAAGWPSEVLAARCPGCGYTYEVAAGDEHEGFAAGTAWADVPDDWCCPDCGVREKVDFVPVSPTTGRRSPERAMGCAMGWAS